MKAVVVVESLARVPRMELLWELLDAAGLSRVKCDVVAAVDEDTKKFGKRVMSAHRDRCRAAIGRGVAVLLIGNVALEMMTGKKGIKQRRGKPWVEEDTGNVYVPIMPPGVVAYDDRAMPMLEADLRLFADVAVRGEIPRCEELNWTIVDCRRKFDEMLADLQGTVSFDVETTGLNPWQGHYDVAANEWVIEAKVISVGFGTRGKQWCLPLHHPEAVSFDLTHAQMMARIDQRLQHCSLVAHNGKFDSLWLKIHYGVDWRCDFDTMLAHWMLDENSLHGLKLLAQTFEGAPNYDVDKDEKHGAGSLHQHCEYLAHDVHYTRKLRFKFGKRLEEDVGVRRAFEQIVMPIARLFVDVEHHGVLVDVDRLDEAEIHLRKELADAEEAMTRELQRVIPGYRPGDVNWRSPQQVARLFFETLGLEVLDKTDGGSPSTNESVLKRLDHPVARSLMKRRAADQMLKMFVDGWRPFLVKHADGWRLHPSFKLHGTVTGRASCERPNLQQVPRDSLIRSLIMAAFGFSLVEMDLSQIEMRISAELSGDQVLLGIFDRDEDVHWKTAITEIARGGGQAELVIKTARKHTGKTLTYAEAIDVVYKMGPDRAAELESQWKDLRKKAKAINFGYLFGMWWKKMMAYARDNYGVHLTERQAQESRKAFFSTYPGLAPWHERQRRYARRHGHVRSLSGALRRLPRARDDDDSPERGEALRQAINSPVQRFACELNFMVLMQLVAEFGLDVVRPIATVHDAILAEVRDDMVEAVCECADEIMRQPDMLSKLGIRLRVPLKGDVKIGNWSRGVSLSKWKEQRCSRSARAKSKRGATVARRTSSSTVKS